MKLLKVCGMREPSNIVEVAALQPDFMGFIFYGQSARYVGDKFEMPELSAKIKKVGVFVNEKTQVMVEAVKRYQLDYVQLHGDETVEQVAELKQCAIGIMKAFRVDESFDFSSTIPFQDQVDFFLFDTKGKYYGGNNITFDWSLLTRYNQKTPFLLSGGLNAENLRDTSLLSGMNCAGFDVNSGVEIKPGLKDVPKIQELMFLKQTR